MDILKNEWLNAINQFDEELLNAVLTQLSQGLTKYNDWPPNIPQFVSLIRNAEKTRETQRPALPKKLNVSQTTDAEKSKALQEIRNLLPNWGRNAVK